MSSARARPRHPGAVGHLNHAGCSGAPQAMQGAVGHLNHAGFLVQLIEASFAPLCRPVPDVSSFYPETYRLDVQRERTEFFSKYKGGGAAVVLV